MLVSSVDGVGTKLKIAFEMDLHHTVGGDLVNHCVNDIAVQGAAPLFFMDYFATGKLEPEIAEKVVSGIADACKQNGCALIGGETAEMPGFYPDGEYDLAGFIVGVVERDKIITGKDVQPGDVLVGLPSTGLHTNGYSLARKLLFSKSPHYTPDTYVNEIKGKVGTELMQHPQELLAHRAPHDRCRSRHRHGSHHRRRHHREPAARAAQGRRRHCRDRNLAGPAHLRAPAEASATFPRTRCCAPSTWASA